MFFIKKTFKVQLIKYHFWKTNVQTKFIKNSNKYINSTYSLILQNLKKPWLNSEPDPSQDSTRALQLCTAVVLQFTWSTTLRCVQATCNPYLTEVWNFADFQTAQQPTTAQGTGQPKSSAHLVRKQIRRNQSIWSKTAQIRWMIKTLI